MIGLESGLRLELGEMGLGKMGVVIFVRVRITKNNQKLPCIFSTVFGI